MTTYNSLIVHISYINFSVFDSKSINAVPKVVKSRTVKKSGAPAPYIEPRMSL